MRHWRGIDTTNRIVANEPADDQQQASKEQAPNRISLVTQGGSPAVAGMADQVLSTAGRPSSSQIRE
jgi:hypothetical protein